MIPTVAAAGQANTDTETAAAALQQRLRDAVAFMTALSVTGDCREVRCRGADNHDKRIDAGWSCDPAKLAMMAVRADKFDQPRGIYITCNPCDPALQARASDRIKQRQQDTTQDQHIWHRCWLLIDIDPVRPSGIMATDAERDAAAVVAEDVRDWLMSNHGWGEPIEVDSGNGRYLLFPIDLPNDDESLALVRSCLKAISQHCGASQVKIDTTVSNASRIMRIPGTTNRKGENAAAIGRPHRVATLLHVPDYLQGGWREPVPVERLRAVAALVADERPRAAPGSAPSTRTGPASRSVIERARKYLATIPPAVSGQGGHSQTLLAAEHLVRGFDLSDDEAFPLLNEWNQHCVPPWSDAELQHKLKQARDAGTAVAIGQHLRDDRPASSTRTEARPAARREPAGMPSLHPGELVKALDRDNFGTVVEDRGELCLVRFVSPDGQAAEVELLKSQLASANGAPVISDGFALKLMKSDEFARADFRRHFFIKGVLVEGQHGVAGGPQKCLKTGLMLDMAVSLGTGTPFLSDDRFLCPKTVRTCLLSGESGGFTLRETAQRICEARGRFLHSAEILWGFDLPQLANPAHLEVLAKTIADEGIQVMMIDPAYLCLLSGDTQGRNPANVFAMGSILKEVGQVGQETGCTLLIAHHTRKAGRDDRFAQTSLEDLTMSGFPEWARQWLLIGRRADFKDGVHQLWLNVGGSAGHSGSYCVTVDEGIANDDDARRKWDVTVETAGEAIERQKTAREAAKSDARLAKLERLNEVIGQHPDGETKSILKDLAGLRTAEFDDLLEDLLARNSVEPCRVQKGRKSYGGFRRVKGESVSRDKSGQVGIPDCPDSPE